MKLLWNEIQKLINRKGLILLIVLLMLSPVGYGMFVRRANPTVESENWRAALQDTMQQLQPIVSRITGNFDTLDADTQSALLEYEVCKYALAHEISNSDWRKTLIDQVVYANLTGEDTGYANLREIVEQNNWREYLEIQDAQCRARQAEYGQNTYGYDAEGIYHEKIQMQLRYNIPPNADEWRAQQLNQWMTDRISLLRVQWYGEVDAQDYLTDAQCQSIRNRVAEAEYRIDRNIPPYTINSTENFLLNAEVLYVTVLLVAILLVCTAVHTEYTYNTLLPLYCNPISRNRLMCAKYFASMAIAIVYYIALMGCTIVTGLTLFSTNGFADYLTVYDGVVYATPFFGHTAQVMGLRIVETALFALTAYALALDIRTPSIAMCISLAFVALTVTAPKLFSVVWTNSARWIPFLSFNFVQYLNGTLIANGLNIPFSIAIDLIFASLLITFSAWTVQKAEV